MCRHLGGQAVPAARIAVVTTIIDALGLISAHLQREQATIDGVRQRMDAARATLARTTAVPRWSGPAEALFAHSAAELDSVLVRACSTLEQASRSAASAVAVIASHG